MKVHNPPTETLQPELQELLAERRTQRAFYPKKYLEAKLGLLGAYFEDSGLRAAVVPVSGGLDSAVVAAICREAQRRGLIQTLRLVTLPVRAPQATRQGETVSLAQELAQTLDSPLVTIELGATHQAVAELSEASVTEDGAPASDWARGQLVAHLRTPALAYQATLLSDAGQGAVIIGTTNRDEGAYLGYVGKFSDGMVDVQLISDLHKSEVRALARHLGVPERILQATPTGDMFDGRSDTEVFGAPYDFVELLIDLRADPAFEPSPSAAPETLGTEAAAQFRRLEAHLERLHRYNRHKYLVGSPAIHLNVLKSATRGGWSGEAHEIGGRRAWWWTTHGMPRCAEAQSGASTILKQTDTLQKIQENR